MAGRRGIFLFVLTFERLLERTGFVGDMRELLEIPHRMVIGRVIYVAPGVYGQLAVKERHAMLRLVGRAVHSIFRNRNFRSFAPVGYLRK